MALFLELLGFIMSGDGLKLLHSGNVLAKMSLVDYVSVMAWFNNVIGWFCFWNGLV